MWFTRADAIVRITTSGEQTAFAVDSPFGIVAGPDRALWFTATDRVGRLALDGTVDGVGAAHGLAAGDDRHGPDGELWFTLNQASAIGRIDVRGDLMLRDTPTRGAGPVGIAATHDALWFTEILAGRIGRIADEAPIQELAAREPGREAARGDPRAVRRRVGEPVGRDQIAHVSDDGEIATLDLPAGQRAARARDRPRRRALGRPSSR